MPPFSVVAPFTPAGDQPKAIARAERRAHAGRQVPDAARRHRLGQDDDARQRHRRLWASPTLVLSHNKTLAAQLYGELRQFLPGNAVEYFVSYYDYYQPEAYVPATDVYIEKDASINQDIEMLRLRATSSLMERDDVVIVATVSAIYGLGDPVGVPRSSWSRFGGASGGGAIRSSPSWSRIHYSRNDRVVRAGHLPRPRRFDRDLSGLRRAGGADRALGRRGRADQQDQPAHRPDHRPARPDARSIRPSTSSPSGPPSSARSSVIRAELAERLHELKSAGKLLEAQRLESRTNFDIEMMLEVGTCAGIENYSRPAVRPPGRRAPGVSAGLLPRRLSRGRRTSPTSRCRRSAGCSTATAPGSSRWSSTASGCRRRSTTGRSSSTSSWGWCRR